MVDSYSCPLGYVSFRVRFVSYTFSRTQAIAKQTIIKSQPIKIEERDTIKNSKKIFSLFVFSLPHFCFFYVNSKNKRFALKTKIRVFSVFNCCYSSFFLRTFLFCFSKVLCFLIQILLYLCFYRKNKKVHK